MAKEDVSARIEQRLTVRERGNQRMIYGGDPCPGCGIELGWDEQEEDGEWKPFLIHPDPQCGWVPDGYPST